MIVAQRLLPPLLGALLALVAAWITTGSRSRRRLGLVVGLGSMLSPWLLPASPPIVRCICVLVAFTWVMRVVDLTGMEWPLPRRLLHVLSAIDSRRLVRAPPRIDLPALGQGLAWVAVVGVGLGGLAASRHLEGAAYWISRWASGLVLVYAAVAGLYRFLVVGYGALGFRVPPLHLAPILSRSVQELWGERWARPISDWLGETFFRPHARRRRPLTGVLLAFAVSAAFHAYAVWVSLGLVEGLSMGALTFAYFLLQGAIMKLERAAGVRRWSPWAGHAWTVVWMVTLSPGFTEPIVRVLGFPAREAP